MKTRFLALVAISVLALTSCSKDDSSLYGTLKVRYGMAKESNLVPGTLELYSTDNQDVVLMYIESPNRKTVTEKLLVGNYILKGTAVSDEGDEYVISVVFQILPDRTTKLYYYGSLLTFDDDKYASTAGTPEPGILFAIK